VDAGTTGEEGMLVFERILAESVEKRLPCAAIVILNEEQAEWADKLHLGDSAAALVRPVGTKLLYRKLRELLGTKNGT
jgi:hypothetical protein